MIKRFLICTLVALFFVFTSHAANYFWVGNSGSWSDVSHWATTSGGSTKYTVPPTSLDDVFFDANSFSIASQTVTVTFGAVCRSMNWTGATNTPKISSFFDNIDIYGSLIIPATVNRDFLGNVRFKATSGAHTVDLANLPLSTPNNEVISFEGVGGTWTLSSGLTIYRVDLKGGTLNTNNQPLTISLFSSSGANARALTLGSSAIACATWDIQSATGLTITSGTSAITTTFRFNGKGLTYNNLIISGTVELYDNNIFNTITLQASALLKLKEGTTQTISGLVSNGSAGSPVTIKTVTDGAVATFSKASGSVSINNARIQDNTATGGATFSAPVGSVDLGNVTGWNITVVEPTTQVTSALFTKVLPTSVELRWTIGNGSKRLVLVRQSGTTFVDDPIDGTTYTAGAFGVGGTSMIGTGNYVVYSGNADRTVITGLTANTAYFFKVYEFSGTGATSNFLIASEATATTTTLPSTAVIMSNSPVTVCTGKYYDTGGDGLYNYSNNESFTQTLTPATAGNKLRLSFTDFFTSSAADALKIYDGADTSAPLIGTYSGSTSPGIVTTTNGAGKLTIQFTSDAFIQSTGWEADISCTVLDTEPTTAASALNFTSVAGQSLRLNWTNGNGAKRIVIARAASVVNFVPVDGTDYTANASFGTGTALATSNFVVYNGSGSFVDVTNLLSSTTYHFSVYEYSGANTSINYRTTGAVANQTTLSTAAEPTVAASTFGVVGRSENALNVNWVNGNGVRRVVVMKLGSAVTATPVDGTLYTFTGDFATSTDLGGGNKVVYSGSSNQASIAGLTTQTTYHFAVYEFNGTTNGTTNYLLTTPAIGSATTLVAAPSANPALTVTNTLFTTTNLSWPNAGGAEKYVVAMSSGSPTANLQDGVEYSGNAVFGQGSQAGDPNSFVVFSGVGNSVSVSGLQPNTTYKIVIKGYNGSGVTTNYPNIPFSVYYIYTLKQKPTIQASNLVVTNVATDSMHVSWQRGNGSASMVVIRTGSPVITNFHDSITVGNYNNTYGLGTTLGNGNMVMYTGNGNSAKLKGLNPNTTYHLAVFEYNSTSIGNSTYNYFLSSNPATATTTTLPGKNYYWVGGTGRWSQFQSHWATASGGSTFHSSEPTSADNVYFDAASFTKDTDSVYFDHVLNVRDMDWSAISKKATFITVAAPGSSKCWNDISIYGSLKLSALMNLKIAMFSFRATTKGNVIDWAGKTLSDQPCGANLQFNGYEGEWTMSPGDLTVNNVQFNTGKVIATNTKLNAQAVNVNSFNNLFPELVLGNSIITTSNWLNIFNLSTPLTVNGGTIIFNNSGNTQFDANGAAFRKVVVKGTSLNVVKINGGFTLDSLIIDPGREVRFESGKIFRVGSMQINGDSTKITTLRSSIPGSPFIFSKTTGTIKVNYAIIKDNQALGGAQFAADNSVDAGNVTGWSFTVPPLYLPKKSASAIEFRRVFRTDLKMKWISGDGLKRIVVMKEGSAVDRLPSNGKSYTANSSFGTGTDLGGGNFVVYNGVLDSTSVKGLSAGKTYHTTIFEYNEWSGGLKYRTTFSARANVKMVGANDVIFSDAPISACNVRFFDEGGRGYYTENKSITQTITPSTVGSKLAVVFTSFEPGPFDSLIVYDGNSVAAQVLAKYHSYGTSSLPKQAIVATNATGALTFLLKARDSSAEEDQHKGWEADLFCVGTLATEPTVQSSGLTATPAVDGGSLEVKVTKGNGAGRIIIAREGAAVSKFPPDGFWVTDNVSFGQGSTLGEGNYVVYKGTSDVVLVTGLKSNTTYHFAAIEYNGADGTVNYLQATPAVGLATTSMVKPTVASTLLSFSDITTNSMAFTFQPGNGGYRMIVARKWKPVAFTPVENFQYTSGLNFGSGTSVGDSTYVILTGQFISGATITNLEQGTPYHIKIFEYNQNGSQVKYLTTPALEGMQKTNGPALTLKKLKATYCPNEKIEASFTSKGIFNVSNTFKLQLSDSLGTFTNPFLLKDTTIVLGAGTIRTVMPNTVRGSLLYKVRIMTTGPVSVSDSIRSVALTDVPNVSIKVTEAVFESSSNSGNQWLLNGAPIAGATSKTFSATDNGVYTVKLTVGSCYKISNPLTYTGLEDQAHLSVRVYPNPIDDHVVIEKGNSTMIRFQLIDALGREWSAGELTEEQTRVNTAGVPPGFLFLRITNGAESTTLKIVKR